jgi:hypothetical protein
VEDSIINCCFNGKFMAVSKCRDCNELMYIEEDFLSLNFDIFKSGQSKHIRELRNNFGDQDKQAGFFKVFSREYWREEVLKSVTINDYMSNLLNYEMVRFNSRIWCSKCEEDRLCDKIYH